MPRTGHIADRGIKGVEYKDKRQVYKGASWVEPQGSVMAFEDFISSEGTLATGGVTINQSGTATAAAAISAAAGGAAGQAGHGGWVVGSVDNVDAEIDEIALGAKPWLIPARAGNGLIVCEAGFVIPTALTARQYFFGFTDDETEGTGTNGSLNIDGTTNVVAVADDAAGLIMSSLATDADGFYHATAKATTAIADATNTGLTAVVDRYTKLRVEIDSAGVCFFYGVVGGTTTIGRKAEVSYVGVDSTGLTATVALIPLFAAAPTTTTAVEWEIDYLFGAGAG